MYSQVAVGTHNQGTLVRTWRGTFPSRTRPPHDQGQEQGLGLRAPRHRGRKVSDTYVFFLVNKIMLSKSILLFLICLFVKIESASRMVILSEQSVQTIKGAGDENCKWEVSVPIIICIHIYL